jgi:hypothetical protein
VPSGATTGVDAPASVTAHEAEVVVGLGDGETGALVGLGLANPVEDEGATGLDAPGAFEHPARRSPTRTTSRPAFMPNRLGTLLAVIGRSLRPGRHVGASAAQ